MKEVFSSDDLLLGPVANTKMARVLPKALFLKTERLSLPQGFEIETCISSRIWNGQGGTVLSGPRGVASVSEGRSHGPFLGERSVPALHIQDGQGQDLYFWRGKDDASPEFLVSDSLVRTPIRKWSVSNTPASPLSQRLLGTAAPPPAPCFRQGAFFVDAFPAEAGAYLFWIEVPEHSQKSACPDWELMTARWMPQKGAYAFADSLAISAQSRESLALIGESAVDAYPSITQTEKGFVAVWIAREGERRFVKSLRINRNHNYGFSNGLRQRYLSGKLFEEEVLGDGKEVELYSNDGKTALALCADGAYLLLAGALAQGGSPRSEKLLSWKDGSRFVAKETGNGFLIAWLDEGLHLGAINQGELLFERPVSSRAKDFLLTGSFLVWLEAAKSSQTLWAVALDGRRPESLQEGLSKETSLGQGEDERFYLFDKEECLLCSITNRGLRAGLSSTIGKSVR